MFPSTPFAVSTKLKFLRWNDCDSITFRMAWPLIAACFDRTCTAITTLLNHGCDVNMKRPVSESVFQQSFSAHHVNGPITRLWPGYLGDITGHVHLYPKRFFSYGTPSCSARPFTSFGIANLLWSCPASLKTSMLWNCSSPGARTLNPVIRWRRGTSFLQWRQFGMWRVDVMKLCSCYVELLVSVVIM